jgi:hypothetical protein
MSRGAAVFAVVMFLVALGATTALLWFSDRLPLSEQLGGAAVVAALLWAIGRVCEPAP